MITQDLTNFIFNNFCIGTSEYNFKNGETLRYYIFQKGASDTGGVFPAMVYPGASEVEPMERVLKRIPSMPCRSLPGFVFAVADYELFKFCREHRGNIATMLNTFIKTQDLNHKAYDTLLCYLRREYEAKRELLEGTDC